MAFFGLLEWAKDFIFTPKRAQILEMESVLMVHEGRLKQLEGARYAQEGRDKREQKAMILMGEQADAGQELKKMLEDGVAYKEAFIKVGLAHPQLSMEIGKEIAKGLRGF